MNATDAPRPAAACADTDPELFFPIGDEEGEGHSFVQVQEAKTICAGCTIRDACLERGMDDPFGIWGGTTPRDRRRLRLERARRPHVFA